MNGHCVFHQMIHGHRRHTPPSSIDVVRVKTGRSLGATIRFDGRLFVPTCYPAVPGRRLRVGEVCCESANMEAMALVWSSTV
jgi:hypothetical protein